MNNQSIIDTWEPILKKAKVPKKWRGVFSLYCHQHVILENDPLEIYGKKNSTLPIAIETLKKLVEINPEIILSVVNNPISDEFGDVQKFRVQFNSVKSITISDENISKDVANFLAQFNEIKLYHLLSKIQDNYADCRFVGSIKEEENKNDSTFNKISSIIKTITYDEGTQDLYIEFNNGAQYTYYDVESEKVEELKNAESQGSYLNKEIKKNYQYKRTDK